MRSVEIILYVRDQAASRDLYSALLRRAPVLDVPGMTEFELTGGVKLGLMPHSGIARILGEALPHPQQADGVPRCELYLQVGDLDLECNNAIASGARLISAKAARDWGDTVAYFADHDGHVIAFAQRTSIMAIHRSAADMVKEATQQVENLSPEQVRQEIQNGATLIDVREPDELRQHGKIAGSVNAPRGMIEFYADPSLPYHRKEFDRDARIILHCASGGRSALAARTLQQMGYGNVAHLEGGINAWKSAGMPTEP